MSASRASIIARRQRLDADTPLEIGLVGGVRINRAQPSRHPSPGGLPRGAVAGAPVGSSRCSTTCSPTPSARPARCVRGRRSSNGKRSSSIRCRCDARRSHLGDGATALPWRKVSRHGVVAPHHVRAGRRGKPDGERTARLVRWMRCSTSSRRSRWRSCSACSASSVSPRPDTVLAVLPTTSPLMSATSGWSAPTSPWRSATRRRRRRRQRVRCPTTPSRSALQELVRAGRGDARRTAQHQCSTTTSAPSADMDRLDAPCASAISSSRTPRRRSTPRTIRAVRTIGP